MKPLTAQIIFILTLATFSSFGQFAVCVDSGIVSYDEIIDASAMASSKLQDSVVWVCNGHSYPNRIYALNNHGDLLAIYHLKDLQQLNWEDMASGPGPDPAKTYLYVGEIGNNEVEFPTKTVYRFVEPYVTKNGRAYLDTIKEIDALNFVYPDSVRDAEALMVDPLTKDYFIITKREANARVYRASYPQPTSTVDTLEFLDSLPNIAMVTAADISQSGLEILIKNYYRIYYWKREQNESIIHTILKPSMQKVPYIREPVGEGMCWSRNAEGYFTISEERDTIDCRLYYYARPGAGVSRGAPLIKKVGRPIPDYRLFTNLSRITRGSEGVDCFDVSGRMANELKSAIQPLIHRIPYK
jgi:hypothetical protein